ncbi:MAG: BrnA antitoxin family protein [Acidobacteria bacterium]|nr:BrnA antitoxin family protein [Acidobacteriota bacterium]
MKQLTAKQRADLLRLAQRPDHEIDLSDIPEIREFPSDAIVGRFYRPKKQSVTIRLDVDVLAWLKMSGDGYQTRVNTYLRELMTKQRAS